LTVNAKPRVERPMPYVRDSYFAGRDFAGLADARARALVWCVEVAGVRACRAIEGAKPLSLFEATEAEHLVALPGRPFELAVWSKGKVHPDCHVKVGPTLYSVPWRHIGTEVDARQGAETVAIYRRDELIKTHARKEKGRQTDYGDYPPEKIAFMQKTPAWCRNRSVQIGPACAEVIDTLLAPNVLYRLRAAQGILGLADKHGVDRLEGACGRALAAGDPSYKTIKGVLRAGTETDPAPAEHTGQDTPAFLRGQAGLFEEVVAS
jgi:hypothetical protein